MVGRRIGGLIILCALVAAGAGCGGAMGPTEAPTAAPTDAPTAEATPTEEMEPTPTPEPTAEPTAEPTEEPTAEPTEEPTAEPTDEPTEEPTATAEPTPTATTDDAPAEGQVLLEERCTVCHSLARVESAQKTREEWASTVDRMIDRGAQLSDGERTVVIDYLAETYGP